MRTCETGLRLEGHASRVWRRRSLVAERWSFCSGELLSVTGGVDVSPYFGTPTCVTRRLVLLWNDNYNLFHVANDHPCLRI